MQDEAITGVHQSVLSGIGGKNTNKQINRKALPLLRRWDLREDCLIISGQMRHFAPDFIAFLIHYSCLTSHGGNAISGQTATGREN